MKKAPKVRRKPNEVRLTMTNEDAETVLGLLEDTLKQDFYCRVCKNADPGGKWYCKDNLFQIIAILQGKERGE